MTYFIFFSCTYLQQKLKINSDWGRHKTFSEMKQDKKKLDTMYHICAHCDFIFIIIFSEDSGFFCVQPPNLSRSQITHLFIVYKTPISGWCNNACEPFQGWGAKFVFLFWNYYSISISFQIIFFLHSIHTKNITSSYNN